VSTHDLELALRMADTVWVIGPDRRLHSGAPEDMILDGRIQEAFPAQTIHFLPKERTFRPVIASRGSASAHGEGLVAALAEAVLEREGFKIVPDAGDSLKVFASEGARWEAVVRDTHRTGEGFGALAEYVRGVPEIAEQATKATAEDREPDKIGR
jgi:iron complex transport system ATP-binding protein